MNKSTRHTHLISTLNHQRRILYKLHEMIRNRPPEQIDLEMLDMLIDKAILDLNDIKLFIE